MTSSVVFLNTLIFFSLTFSAKSPSTPQEVAALEQQQAVHTKDMEVEEIGDTFEDIKEEFVFAEE